MPKISQADRAMLLITKNEDLTISKRWMKLDLLVTEMKELHKMLMPAPEVIADEAIKTTQDKTVETQS